MDRYVVIDETTHIVMNVILWDAIAPWKPPIGHYVVRADFGDGGDRYDKTTDTFIGANDGRIKKNVILPPHLVESRNLIIEPGEYQ